MSVEKIQVVYRVQCAADEDAFARLRAVVLEQTVEIPDDAVSLDLERRVVGHLGAFDRLDKRLWRAVVDYPLLAAGTADLPQLLNFLFGNVALYDGVRVEAIHWPKSVLAGFRGPRHGRDGLRALCPAAGRRPLIVGAIKALGETSRVLAERAGALARAGFDIVKDDHGLANQESAPFAQRVAACAEAIAAANATSGGKTLYAPNVTAPVDQLAARVELARDHGCRAVMLSPWLVGLDTMRALVAATDVAVIAHPALAGAFAHPEHGLAPEIAIGDLLRLAGADGVIFPWSGGRFRLDQGDCERVLAHLHQPLGDLLPTLAVVGGGLPIDREPPRLPPDVGLLFGGFLYREQDFEGAARQLVERVERFYA